MRSGTAGKEEKNKKGKQRIPSSRWSGQEYEDGDVAPPGIEDNQDEILKGNYFVLGANNR